MRYVPSRSAKRTGCSPAQSAPAAVPPPSKACSPPPSSMAWILLAGSPTPSKNFRHALTARSTRCYRSRTLRRSERRWKVDPLAAYYPASYGRAAAARLLIFCPAIDQCRFRSPHRMGAIGGWVKTDRMDPSMNNPRVLSCGKMRGIVDPAWKQKVAAS